MIFGYPWWGWLISLTVLYVVGAFVWRKIMPDGIRGEGRRIWPLELFIAVAMLLTPGNWKG